MQYSLVLLAAFTIGQPDKLEAGDHRRTLTIEKEKRRHNIHVPPKYDPKKPTAVVLAIHGFGMVDKMMERFTGLSDTADEHNFVVVYPNGTGVLQSWNAGAFPGNNKHDDVAYLGKVLDDVEGALNVDKKRIFVCGLSNGAMMSYRVASAMSERIAAIAPVAGTMAIDKYEPKRPVPVVHFHGTKDTLVPFKGPANGGLKIKSVNDTIMACVKANGCTETPTETVIDGKEDKLKVTRKEYGKSKAGADVILYTIEEGGHTWPGMTTAPPILGLGQSTKNISANEVMWEFFKKHPLP